MRSIITLVLLGIGAPAVVSAQTAGCVDPLLQAVTIPETVPDSSPGPAPYNRLYVHEVSLGVGHVRPVDSGYVWEWYSRVRLPLFAEPGGAPVAWIADGWLIDSPTSQARPFGTAGMIETEYETPSFIVAEQRDDGWIRLRYAADGADGGHAWVHQCLLNMGPDTLVFESWADRLMDDEISPLFFHQEVRHSLRAGPTVDAERVLWIPATTGAYGVQPLEIQGEWMRVAVTIPSTYCVEPDEVDSVRYEGWVKWRDDGGPWLWYYTRGC
jgi:hypothetical protein